MAVVTNVHCVSDYLAVLALESLYNQSEAV